MKEIYIAPELELLSLAPAERVASDFNNTVDFDLFSVYGGERNGVTSSEIDIDMVITSKK